MTDGLSAWTSVLDDTDAATARLIVETQLSELAGLGSFYGRGGVDDDARAAREVYEVELRGYLGWRRDELQGGGVDERQGEEIGEDEGGGEDERGSQDEDVEGSEQQVDAGEVQEGDGEVEEAEDEVLAGVPRLFEGVVEESEEWITTDEEEEDDDAVGESEDWETTEDEEDWVTTEDEGEDDEVESKSEEMVAAGWLEGANDRRDDSQEQDQPTQSFTAMKRPTSCTAESASNKRRKQDDESAGSIAEEGMPVIECVACADAKPVDDIYAVPCQHYYCGDCLTSLFATALSDESCFPPRCCSKAIAFEDVKIWLTSELAKEFEDKKEELESTNRTYCCNASCLAYISAADHIHGVGTCPNCQHGTCITCKAAAHDGDCPEDKELSEVLKVADEQGWQRCPTCKSLIEITFGCNHMTCKCKAQFCYVCAAPWKTCECPQWDEERLLDRAQALADRGVGGGDAQAAAAQLEANHECDHPGWRTIRTSGICEECGDYMYEFILQCTDCNMLACRSCSSML